MSEKLDIKKAFARGENPYDDGADLTAPEELAAFQEGRARWHSQAAAGERMIEADNARRSGTLSAEEAERQMKLGWRPPG